MVATSYLYEPFGKATTQGVLSPNAFQFTGRESDGTGLTHYRARYYYAYPQRFISEDRLGFAGGDQNLYAYVGNRPLTATDPLGLFNVLVGGQVSAIGITGVEGSGGVFVNFGGGSQQPEVGAFGYAGMGTGVDVGYGWFGGFAFGGADAVAGITANISVSVGPLSVSALFNDKGWAGMTIGAGPTAVPLGGSATVGKTGTWTLSDLLDLLLGKRPPTVRGTPSKSKSSQ
jgi:RHS repeat-associated protein